MTKVCGKCRVEKPVTEYHKCKSKRDGLMPHCKPCNIASAAQWRKANRGRRQAYMRKRTYGITQEQFDQMLADQDGRCAICLGSDPKGRGSWKVDHCHDTGKVRGLLCHHCNLLLGHASDNTDVLLAASAYLMTHQPSLTTQ